MASGRKHFSDPNLTEENHEAHENRRYEHPIPSRNAILQLFKLVDAPIYFDSIADQLDLKGDRDLNALRNRLRAMVRDDQLFCSRHGAFSVAPRSAVSCLIIGHRDGYGFARPYGPGEDLFLPAHEMAQVFDGDEAQVSILRVDARGRAEGQIAKVLKRAQKKLVGSYFVENGTGFFCPHNARLPNRILIPLQQAFGAMTGQIVLVELTEYPSSSSLAKGKVVEILGDHLDPGLEIDVAIRSHNIPWRWPDAVLREVALLSDQQIDPNERSRVDLRATPFITIDGETAKDLDDAVWSEPNERGFRLMVAIADVSHYVSVGSALDIEASSRGNSVYFPERVVPMFPEVLSNGLCSLNPGVDRLALVCDMQINFSGMLEDYTFFEAVINSHGRLTYTEVAAEIEQDYPRCLTIDRRADIDRLHKLYRVLHAARVRRGALDFDTCDTEFHFDEYRKIASIKAVYRNDAHRLIEECMLLANVATAKFLQSLDYPSLFRVHEGPTAEKLENLRAFLGELSLWLAGDQKPTPSDYHRLLTQAEGREDASIIQTMLLRSLSQAVYQPENVGHFGLHYEAYTHFTSPIRRYPDLLVHRAIVSAIRGKTDRKHIKRVAGASRLDRENIYPYDLEVMLTLGEKCSMTERRADDACREVDAWLKCEFLKNRVGEQFQGIISAVTNFGVFVELSGLYIEGLLHISTLPGDYYHYEQARQRLVGERTRRIFKLGGLVAVRIAQVDLNNRTIDLHLNLNAKQRQSGTENKVRRGKNRSRSASRRGKSKQNFANIDPNASERTRGEKILSAKDTSQPHVSGAEPSDKNKNPLKPGHCDQQPAREKR